MTLMPHESTVDHASVLTPTNHTVQKVSVGNEGKVSIYRWFIFAVVFETKFWNTTEVFLSELILFCYSVIALLAILLESAIVMMVSNYKQFHQCLIE